MPERFSTETVKRIFDDKFSDEYLEIGLDADTGDLIEIRSVTWNSLTNKPTIVQRITIHPEAIDLLVSALEFFKPR